MVAPLFHWLSGFILISLGLQGSSFSGHNTPPVFDFKREWLIQENEPIGSRVTKVRTRDEDGDTIKYGIEAAAFVDGSQYFRINKDTGDVYLAKSLDGLGGNDFYLYITANDGHQTAKIEVYVRVLEPSDLIEPTLDVPFSTSRPPGRSRPFPGRLPPFVPVPPPPPADPSFGRGHPLAPAVGNTRATPSAPAAVPSVQPPVRPVPEGEGGGKAEDRGTSGAASEVTTAVLPAVILTGLAPVVMLLLWFLHRKCTRGDKLRTLKKAVSASRNDSSLSSTIAFSYSPSALLRQSGGDSESQNALNHILINPLSKDSKWEFPRHQLHFLGILGEGCFGQVWKCEITSADSTDSEPNIIAVKTLKENATEKEKKDLLAELEIMKLLDSHTNVVTLLGCCTNRDPVLLLMEYVSGGKLLTYLRESRAERQYGNLHASSEHLSSRDLTSFSYQVAKGMEYLSSKGIIHRDLAARNVLVDANKTCKIADFGFARDVLGTHVYERKSEGCLPIRWMAPESLFDNIFTTKTDVWSFGVLFWEIVTLGSTPYPGLNAGQVMKKVRDGYRLEKPEHCKREMYNIMFYCWEKNPMDRPQFSELASLLDKLLISECAYIELERFPDHAYYNMTEASEEEKR